MSKKLKELRSKRNEVVTAARALLDTAESEKRDLTSDEQVKWDSLMDDQQRHGDSIASEERMIEAERSLADKGFVMGEAGEAESQEGRSTGPTATPEYRAAFTRALTGQANAEDFRALSAGNATEGGYLVLPEQTVQTLIKAVDDELFIRRMATVIPVPSATSLGAASLDTDPDDAAWTSEIATGNEDSSMAFGKRELTPNPLAKRIKMSNKLLRQSPSAEAIVMARLGHKFAVTQEKAFLTGDGAKQPLGLFTASDNGITTARDVSEGNNATAFTIDGLINAKYSTKAQYQRVAQWLFHRDAIKMLAKLKDGDGQYIWQPSKTEADPDMLLGRPVNISEYAPNTFTSGLYVGMFGDFSNYWIADAMNVQIQRLTELYAEQNQTGFIGRLECDGMPVLSEAFARVKLG